MSNTIITSIIAATATLVGSVLGAIATVKAARIQAPTAGREQGFGAFVHDLLPAFLRSAWIWILISLVVGLVVGLGVQDIRRKMAKTFEKKVMGDLYHFECLKLFSVTDTRHDTDTKPWWRSIGESAITGLKIGEVDSAGKRGSDGALRVQVDLDGDEKYAEVGIGDTELPKEPVDLIMAWVFVRSTAAARIEARLVGCTQDKDKRVFAAYGEPVEVRSGKWTLVVLGAPYEAAISPPPDAASQRKYVFESAARRLTSLSIIFKARAAQYVDDIYVDDVGLYHSRMRN